MALLAGLLHPSVEKFLLVSEHEFVVDEVHRHWITRVPGIALVVLGMLLFLAMPSWGEVWVLGLIGGLVAGGLGFWRIHRENMDRFVLTNMRVYRVKGVFNQHMASVPIARILDISVERPFWGQVLGFGHFVFESAAQDQGLKRIEFVPRIVQRDQTIQTVIQRAGLRASMRMDEEEFFGPDEHSVRVPAPPRRRRWTLHSSVDGT